MDLSENRRLFDFANDAKSMPADCNDNVTITPLVVHDQEERVNQ